MDDDSPLLARPPLSPLDLEREKLHRVTAELADALAQARRNRDAAVAIRKRLLEVSAAIERAQHTATGEPRPSWGEDEPGGS